MSRYTPVRNNSADQNERVQRTGHRRTRDRSVIRRQWSLTRSPLRNSDDEDNRHRSQGRRSHRRRHRSPLRRRRSYSSSPYSSDESTYRNSRRNRRSLRSDRTPTTRTLMRLLAETLRAKSTNQGNNGHLIPEFDPAVTDVSAERWLHRINKTAEVYGWDNKHKLVLASSKLRKTAKEWFDTCSDSIAT